jgi:predicted RNase H-like HicB family nuclease
MTKLCSVKILPIPTKAKFEALARRVIRSKRPVLVATPYGVVQIAAYDQKVSEVAKRYPKIIEWSDEDNCYIGSAPPLIGQSCHGPTEAGVLKQLQVIVEEVVEIILVDGNPFPEPLLSRKQTVAK